MSNTNTEKVYVLKKDLPNAKAGTEFTFSFKGNWCHYTAIGTNGKGVDHDQSVVENSVDFFELKHPVEHIIGKGELEGYTFDIKQHKIFEQPVEDKRIEVMNFIESVGIGVHDITYRFRTTKSIPKEKYEAVKQAIEKTINGENDNPAPPTLERQDMPLRSTDMQAEKPFENKVGQDSKEDKGWEIISYKHIVLSNELCNGVIIDKSSYHFDYAHGCPNDFAIHSVRRKSDREMFVVDVRYYDEMGRHLPPIKKFFIKEGVMYAQFNEGYGSNDGCLSINSLEKFKLDNGGTKEEPKPLLITDDNVKLFKEEDLYWRVYDDLSTGQFRVKDSASYSTEATFSSAELALAYITLKKSKVNIRIS